MPRLQEKWAVTDPIRRRKVLDALLEIAEDSFEADFNAFYRFCLKDEDDEVRAKAIEGLWEDEDPRLITILVDLVRHDRAHVVREQAAIALGRFSLLTELGEISESYREAIKAALIQTLRDPDEPLEVQRRAVESLGCMSDEDVEAIIAWAYDHPEEKMRISAVYAMGRNASDRWSDAVIAELSSETPEMRYEAAWACGEMRNRRAVPTLIQLIDDPDREVQEAAIWALGQIGGRLAKEALLACSEAGDEVVRDAAEEALLELDFLDEPFRENFISSFSETAEDEPWWEDSEEDLDLEENDWPGEENHR